MTAIMQDRGLRDQASCNIPVLSTKDWNLNELVSTGPRFRPVPRVSCTSNPSDLARKITEHETDGKPLIIEGCHQLPEWPSEFKLRWLLDHYGSQKLEARNMHGDRLDKSISLSKFIQSARTAPRFATKNETERLYAKDVECPSEWQDWLMQGFLFDSLRPHGPTDVLPTSVQTLMCYIGISDTFTPAHKDLCGSIGQNLMSYAESDGSAFWFMTESSAAPDVAEHFHSLGYELDWESHVTTVEEFAAAPFDVYIAEQRVGDLVIVPPRSCHQVVNQGGITIKTSWSRMTIRSLEIALYHELPIYRRVCRPEVYRVKFSVYQTMLQRSEVLKTELNNYRVARNSPCPILSTLSHIGEKLQRLSVDLSTLVKLFDEILHQEFCQSHESLPRITAGPSHGGHSCDFCGADIFQSFFECTSCMTRRDNQSVKLGDGLIICAGCFVEGRTCKCKNMRIGQCGSFCGLLRDRNKAARLIDRVVHDNLSGVDCMPEISDGHFVEGNSPLLFDAAQNFFRIRKEATFEKQVRSCKHGNRKHNCTYALSCRKCHRSTCYKHILELGIHASVAIFKKKLDCKNEVWHEWHITAKARYNERLPALRGAMKTGMPCNLENMLSYVATNFPNAKPIEKNTSFGFYDKPPLLPVSEVLVSEVLGGYDSDAHQLSADEDGVISINQMPTAQRRGERTEDDAEGANHGTSTSKSKRRLKPTEESIERRRKRTKLDVTPPPSDDLSYEPSAHSFDNDSDSDYEENDPGPSRRPTKHQQGGRSGKGPLPSSAKSAPVSNPPTTTKMPKARFSDKQVTRDQRPSDQDRNKNSTDRNHSQLRLQEDISRLGHRCKVLDDNMKAANNRISIQTRDLTKVQNENKDLISKLQAEYYQKEEVEGYMEDLFKSKQQQIRDFCLEVVEKALGPRLLTDTDIVNGIASRVTEALPVEQLPAPSTIGKHRSSGTNTLLNHPAGSASVTRQDVQYFGTEDRQQFARLGNTNDDFIGQGPYDQERKIGAGHYRTNTNGRVMHQSPSVRRPPPEPEPSYPSRHNNRHQDVGFSRSAQTIVGDANGIQSSTKQTGAREPDAARNTFYYARHDRRSVAARRSGSRMIRSPSRAEDGHERSRGDVGGSWQLTMEGDADVNHYTYQERNNTRDDYPD